MHIEPVSLGQLLWRGRAALLCGTLIPLVAIVLVFALTGGQAAKLADRVETEATITSVELSRTITNQYDGNTDTYKRAKQTDIDFTYRTADGRDLTGSHYFLELAEDPAIGDVITIWYAAGDPEVYELAVGHKERNTDALRILALVFGLPVVIVCWYGQISSARAILAVRDTGARKEAVVREPTRDDRKHGREDHLHWQVKGLQPAWSKAPIAQEHRPTPGTAIYVYQKGEAAVWEGEFGPAQKRGR